MKDKILKADYYPDWVNDMSNETLDRKAFGKIMRFYVFQCPTMKKNSSQGITLEKYGWINPWRNHFLKEELMKNVFSDLKKQFIICNNKEIFYNTCSKYKIYGNAFYRKINKERAIIIKDNSRFDSLLYYIRCSLAHGRVLIKKVEKEYYYIMESGKAINDNTQIEVKSRIILKEKTLLRWIDIIEKGPIMDDTYKKVFKLMRKNNGLISIKELKKELKVGGSRVKSAFNLLKSNGIAKYDRSAKYWVLDNQKYIEYTNRKE